MESNQKSVNEDTIKTKQMKLEVEKTAILFIEYQNEFLSDGGKLSKDIIEKSSLVANSADLANKAREMGVKIIHVAFFSTADSEDCKSTCKEIDTTQGPLGGIKAAGYFKEDWNIKFIDAIDAMKPKAGDIVMHKHRLDTFQNTNLKELLDKHGIQTLAVAGLLTHACVESTIRSAYDKDYQVVGLVDCTATNIKGYKDFVMKNTWPLFCEPMTKDQFLTSMEHQDSEKIEGVNKDVKAKESKSLTLNVGLSDANEVVENTKLTVQEHTIVVDGSELSERKELEFVVDGNSEGQSTIKHTRKIDGQVADEQVTSEKKQVTEELNYSNAEVDAVYDCEVIKQPITSTPSLPKLVIFEPPDDEEDEESNEMEAHYGTRNEGFYVLPKCK